MSGFQGIIFDCDGVLFESRQANLAYYNQVFVAFGYPPVTAEQTEKAHLCHTACSADVLAQLLAEEHRAPALAFAAALDYRDFIPHMEPEPHLREMLENLSKRFPLAVATNRGKSICAILEHFGLDRYFTAVINSQDVAKPKPEPDMVLLAARRLKLAAAQCLFVGDSELDHRAAQSAGVQFACYGGGVDGGYRLRDHLHLVEWIDQMEPSQP